VRKLFVILSVLIVAAGCSVDREERKKVVLEKIEAFEQEQWNELTQLILDNGYVNSHIGLYINPDELDGELSQKLKEKGVIRLSVVDLADDCKEVEYSLDWTEYPIGSLYLTWSSCDSKQTKKGYYKDNFNINFIEVWGLGDNWSMWIDSDPL
tara:strand:+ start:325 stop:783 length:459 start_codon:yes stop_codon:yes gene_type:complete